MYNRYIPQPDGSFRRSRTPEASHPQQPNRNVHPTGRADQKKSHDQPETQVAESPREKTNHPANKPSGTGVGGFLRQLLPKDFDTGDLIVVLLLILMAGDCPDDQNTALLTLALYLFM